jgi:hypothetical protein
MRGNKIMLRRRRASGSAIMETGPALYVFLLLILFPMMDLLFIGVDYCGSWYLNHMITRELALRKRPEWPAVITEVGGPSSPFRNGGVGSFMHVISDTHTPTAIGNVGDNERLRVRCTSAVTCAPFLQLPIPGSIPGLSGPATFTFTSERPRENDSDQ